MNRAEFVRDENARLEGYGEIVDRAGWKPIISTASTPMNSTRMCWSWTAR